MSAGDTCRHPTGSLVNYYAYLDATSDLPDRCEWKQYCAECDEVLAQGWDPKEDVNAPDAEHHHVAIKGDVPTLDSITNDMARWHRELGEHCVEASERRYRAHLTQCPDSKP